MSRARPISVWLRIVAARRELIESSEEATPTLAGAVLRTAQPSGRSATNATVPEKKTPAPVCHHGLAGIATLAIPWPTSDSRRPVRRLIGASGR
jgi:hypothetical protein